MVHITFYGHACFALNTGKQNILIDPWFDGNPLSPVKAQDIEAGVILVTHGHDDHLGDAVAIARRTGATIIAPFEIALHCQKQGVKTHAMHLGGSHLFPWGQVKMTPALHGSGLLVDGAVFSAGNPCGYLLFIEGKTIYHSGDTGLFGDMRLIKDYWAQGGLDVALLPIGDNYCMGPDDALVATQWLHPKVVVPMHYNTFPVIRQNPQEFKNKVESRTQSRCVVLNPGESLSIEE